MNSAVNSHRYAIVTVSRRKQRKIRTNLALRRDQKYFHSGRELQGLKLDMRDSHNQIRTRSAGKVVPLIPDSERHG